MSKFKFRLRVGMVTDRATWALKDLVLGSIFSGSEVLYNFKLC